MTLTKNPGYLILLALFSLVLSACGNTDPASSAAYRISGTVKGLSSGQQVTLLNNGSDAVTITSNTGFTFATSLAPGAGYNVTVGNQPVDQKCNIFNGTNTIVNANVTDINVVCDATVVTVLHSFAGHARGDGASPRAGLTSGEGGYLYGTTWEGGSADIGTIFKINSSGDYTLLYSFTGNYYDGLPSNSLVLGSNDMLYGTTPKNDVVGGVFYQINSTLPNSYKARFQFSTAMGLNPSGSLIFKDNVLYGVTTAGGENGAGTLYEINFNIGNNGQFRVVHAFDLATGAAPRASLVFFNNVLYGTTTMGGANESGTIFSIDPADPSSFTTVYDFSGGLVNPTSGGLVSGNNGKLYGMTYAGGKYSSGTIFSIDPVTKTYDVIHEFGSQQDGVSPVEGLVLADDYFYGVTKSGGVYGSGTLFKINPSNSSSYQVLISFDGVNGKTPIGTLVLGNDNHFYGVTAEGGLSGLGTVFRY